MSFKEERMIIKEVENWYEANIDAQLLCAFLECHIDIDELTPKALKMLELLMKVE